MRSLSIFRNRLAIAVVSAMVGAVIAGGVALATNDGNTIHACAELRTGQLRVVDDPSDCNPAEEFLEWGIVGPLGPQGPPRWVVPVLSARRGQSRISSCGLWWRNSRRGGSPQQVARHPHITALMRA